MSLFKKAVVFKTSYDNSHYLEEFFHVYHVAHEIELQKKQICYSARMFNHELNAFAEYIAELGLMGVYPIML